MNQVMIDTSNYRKFQTANPVVQFVISRFYKKLADIIQPLKPRSILDAGCGEGETIARLRDILPAKVVGIDINQESINFARNRFPNLTFLVEDIYDIQYDANTFDLVLCLEVLEHLTDPAKALRSLNRVSSRDIIISVPNEPYFRLGNLLRGKYLSRLGDHPEHRQHWNKKSLLQFLSSEVTPVQVYSAFPWLIAHCIKRRNTK